ncbi:MAG: MlaD family protein [Planctomycetota bacterium]
MSARATNEWKVGAFVVGGIVAVVAALFWLGASRFDVDVVERVTYVDESVQGMEVGAPVKVRGVTIGKVSQISLAPDHRLVEIRAELRVDALRRINAVESGQEITGRSDMDDPQIRVTVASQGITGIKFLDADFFPADTETLALSFEPPDNYVPSVPSTLKSVEAAIREIGNDMPVVVRDLGQLAATFEEKLAQIDSKRLVESIASLAEELRIAVDGTAETGLGADASALIAELRELTQRFDETLVALTAEGGWAERGLADVESVADEFESLVGSIETAVGGTDLPATSAAIRGAADTTARVAAGFTSSGAELNATLGDLRRALRKIEDLAALIERDPAVLLRGRVNPAGR